MELIMDMKQFMHAVKESELIDDFHYDEMQHHIYDKNAGTALSVLSRKYKQGKRHEADDLIYRLSYRHNILLMDEYIVMSALEACGGNKSAAARIMGISRGTMLKKVRKIKHQPTNRQEM